MTTGGIDTTAQLTLAITTTGTNLDALEAQIKRLSSAPPAKPVDANAVAEIEKLKAGLAATNVQIAEFAKKSQSLGSNSKVMASWKAEIDGYKVSVREATKYTLEQVRAQDQAAQASKRQFQEQLRFGNDWVALTRRRAAEEKAAAQAAAKASSVRATAQALEMKNLFNSVKQASVAYTAYGQQVAAASALVQKFGIMQATAYLKPKGKMGLLDDIPKLNTLLKDGTAHVRGFTLAQQALHASLRGVTGVLGGLWLSYAKLIPVLLATAAAAKTVKDSFNVGLELNFMSQFVAVIETRGNQALASVRKLRENIAAATIDKARDSVFTTKEHAEALQKLALAGIDSARGMNLLKTASDAAVFGQTKLADATGMVLDTLYNFNMASQDATLMAESFDRVANVMAHTAVTVNTTFTDLAKAFQNITGVAGTFNIEIEEASALLQSLAEAGIRGQKAGTYVRNFLDDILGAPTSDKAARKLTELGIQRFNPDDFGQFGVSQYIDQVVSKLRELEFVDQQNAIRAITNQRSRRVLRQELIKSYSEEVSLLSRVQELAENAKGRLADMSTQLRDSGKYALLLAQAAYDASIAIAYSSNEVDSVFQRIGTNLQETFNSKEFQSLVSGLVGGVARLLESLTKFFDFVIRNKDVIAGAFGAMAGALTALAGASAIAFLKTIPALTSMNAAALALTATTGKLWLLLSTHPILAVAVAIGTATGAWYAYKKAKEEALTPELETQQVLKQIAELERRRDSLLWQGDTTGFAEYEASKIDGMIAELREKVQTLSIEGAVAVGESLAKSIRTQVEESRFILRDIQSGLTAEGLTGAWRTVQEFVRVHAAHSELLVQGAENRAKYQELVNRYNELKAKDAKAPELLSLSGQISAASKELADFEENLSKVADRMTKIAETRVFSNLSDDFKDLVGKDFEAFNKLAEETQKKLSDLRMPEDVRDFTLVRVNEEAAEAAERTRDLALARAALASGPAFKQLALDEADAAQQLATESRSVAEAFKGIIEAKAVAAGTSYWSIDTLMGFSEAQLLGMTAGLHAQAAALDSTKESVRALTLANIDGAIAQLAALAVTEEAEGVYSRRIAQLKELRDANLAFFAAQDRADGRKNTGRGDRDPIKTRIEEAKTAVQEYKNVMSEAQRALAEQVSAFEVGPINAHARSIEILTENYGAMIAKLREAQAAQGLKGAERQKIDTDIEKLLGEQAKAVGEANKKLAESQRSQIETLEKIEIDIGKKVLTAREAWLREYDGKHGDLKTNLENDIAYIEQALSAVSETGDLNRIDELNEQLDILKGRLLALTNLREFGAWSADIKTSFERAQDAIKALDSTVARLAEKSKEGGLFGVLLGSARDFERANAQRIATIRATLTDLNRQIQRARSEGATQLEFEISVKIRNLEEELLAAEEAIDPNFKEWGDSLGNYIANGIVYGFDQGESPAKAFANFLKAELVKAIAQALSQRFAMSMAGGVAGGQQGVAGGLGNLTQVSGLFTQGGLSSSITSLFGAPAMTTAANAAGVMAVPGGVSGLSTAAGGTGIFAGGLSSSIVPGLSAYGFAQKYGAVGGMAGSVGSTALAGGVAGMASGAGFGAGAMGALSAVPVWGWGAAAALAILGSQGKNPPTNFWQQTSRNLLTGEITSQTNNPDSRRHSPQNLATSDALSQYAVSLNHSLFALSGQVAAESVKFGVGNKDKQLWIDDEAIHEGDRFSRMTVEELKRVFDTEMVSRVFSDLSSDVRAMLDSMRDPMGSIVYEGDALAHLLALMGDNFSILRTEAENFEIAYGHLSDAFSEIGMTIPVSVDGFRSLAAGLDLTTEAGRSAYLQMGALAPAFQELNSAIRAQAEGLERRILELEGNTAAIRERELAALLPANRALQERIWALEDEAAATKRANMERSADRKAELAARRSAEQRMAEEFAERQKTFDSGAEQFTKLRESLLLAGDAAKTLALITERAFADPSGLYMDSRRVPEWVEGGTAASFNREFGEMQARLRKSLSDELSANALRVQNVALAMQELSVGHMMSPYDPVTGAVYLSIRQAIVDASGDVGYAVRDAVSGAALEAAYAQVRGDFMASGPGVASIMAAQAGAAFVSQGGFARGQWQMGADVLAYGRAIDNLESRFRSGQITVEQFDKAVEALSETLPDAAQLLGDLEAQSERATGAVAAVGRAGLESIQHYFRQLDSMVQNLAAAAAEASQPIAHAAAAIGRFNSAATVFGMSAFAAMNLQAEGEAGTGVFKAALPDIYKSTLIAEAAAIASGIVTTADAAKVQELTGLSRDASLLLDGVRAFDPESLEAAFLRLSDALVKGAIDESEYKTLFNVSLDIFEDVESQSRKLTDTFDALRRAAQSLADQLLLDQGRTTLSGAQQLEEAQRQYRTVLAKAMGGDVEAAQDLSGISRSMLDIAKNTYSSSVDYARLFATTVADARAMESIPVPTLPAYRGEDNATVTELRALRKELEALRAEQRDGQAQIANGTNRTAKRLDEWTYNGMPAVEVL